ncbi:MAG: UDP-N-acetylglucosamine 2-epimerase (non-hydrolyzing) [Armatimonadetes bacterium]|nr:UDP-N-acetylglucosamine 2-epimerase (non-hydrolyzing) [Armatimonadota bacterium]
MISVMPIFGTRPEAVKMAPVIRELQRFPDQVRLRIAVTAQHREMLDQILRIFDIRPDFDLNIMQPGQTLAGITTRALSGLDELLSEEKPDLVLVQGDTATVFAGALAAFYHKIAVGHVEAGLRTQNQYDPFPEEMMRRLTGQIADLHFAPTEQSRQNLLQNGVPDDRIDVTGNTVIDALLSVAAQLPDDAPSHGHRQILVTAHRRENWGEPLREVCLALRDLVERHPDIEVVYALHRNPVVRETATEVLGGLDRVRLIEPPDYQPFVGMMKRATLIITDSGGVQEEAPSLGKPVLVVRRTTERPEGVDAGTVKLVGTDRETIVREADRLLDDPAAYAEMAQARNPYGDGQAAPRIREAIFRRFGLS